MAVCDNDISGSDRQTYPEFGGEGRGSVEASFGLRTCEAGYDDTTRRRPDDFERLLRLWLAAVEPVDQLGLVDVPLCLYLLCKYVG